MKSLLQKGIPMIFALILLTLNACKDPCKDVACLNGGACVDGTCVCANGYTGTNCDTAPDPCIGVACLNGGACVNGTCVCANGYSGVNCEIAPNPCAGVTCLNGGVCVNGTCDCPQGWTGSACQTQVFANSVRINRIEIHDFPVADGNGLPWDSFSGPDIAVQVTEGDFDWNSFVFRSGSIGDINVNSSSPLVYTTGLPITLNDIENKSYSLTLIEEDVLEYVFMSGFTPINLTQHPNYLNNIVRIWNTTNSTDIRLYVEWQF